MKFIDEHQKEYIDRLRENVEIASVSGKRLFYSVDYNDDFEFQIQGTLQISDSEVRDKVSDPYLTFSKVPNSGQKLKKIQSKLVIG